MNDLHDFLEHMRNEHGKRDDEPRDPVQRELRQIRRLLAELIRAVLADREMYPDELGELTRSRAVVQPKGEKHDD